MGLIVWIPFVNGNCKNQGLLNVETSVLGAVSYEDGKLGKAVLIGNGTQVQNGISINSNLVNKLGDEYSCAVWVKPMGNHIHYEGAILSSGNWNAKRWAFGLNQTNTAVDMFGPGYNRNLSCSVPVGEWTHIVSTFKNNVGTLYKNGEYIGTYAFSQSIDENGLQSDADNTTVGRETYANGYFGFNGYIQDLRVYNHCLTANEAKQISQGLVLHYPLSDKYIESTTNLITTEDCLSSTCYNGATSKYGYGTNTDIYKTVTTYDGRKGTKVYMGTSGNSCYPYVYINNMYTSDGTNSPAYKTLSFDYYGTIGNYLIPYKLGSGNGTATYKVTCQGIETTGSNNNSVSVQVTPNKWNHVEITFHGTTEADSQWGYIRIGNGNHTSNTSNFWFFANMQLEAKDHTTGYAGVNGTRSEAIIYDISGYSNNGTINGELSVSDDSPRYNISVQFNGTQYIQLPFSCGTISEAVTVVCWGYESDWNTTYAERLIGAATGSSGWCIGDYGSENTLFAFYANGSYNGASGFKQLSNGWHHFAITFDGFNLKYYVDGVLFSSKTFSTKQSATGVYNIQIGQHYGGACSFKGKISDVRIYATALSADEVKYLYDGGDAS